MGDTGDFKDKQFTQGEVADKVVEQYDEFCARVFYKVCMGGGDANNSVSDANDIHYGVYTNAADTVYESSKETNKRLLQAMDWGRPITPESFVLDLGSGHGGISHDCALKYGCKVHGVNISPEQNKMNLEAAEKHGVGNLVTVDVLNFNDGLPQEWTGKFTHIVSCEVLCHAADKAALFKELKRVMVPGGAFAFTDIMGADGADEKALKDFTDRNATTKMARPSDYMTMLKTADFRQVSYLDFSPHLVHFFQGMVDQINKHRADMVNVGVTDAYLDKWLDSLTSRVDIQKEHSVFAWGIFTCRLDGPIY